MNFREELLLPHSDIGSGTEPESFDGDHFIFAEVGVGARVVEVQNACHLPLGGLPNRYGNVTPFVVDKTYALSLLETLVDQVPVDSRSALGGGRGEA